ncbi:MAG TPA: hypothetical protein VK171_13100 [Fimbriimonas sp.]|nr:hypothetical protein [Fimbriimonas sp.]
MAQSRQGRLFKQITETPFSEIPWDVFCEYSDYKRGLKTFEKLIRAENDKLPEPIFDTNTNLWDYGPNTTRTSLEGLMMVIGRMKTDASFELLREFAEGAYHPYVNVEAVWGLTWVGCEHRSELFRIARQLLTSPRHEYDYYSGLQIFDFLYYLWKPSKYIPLVKSVLENKSHNYHTHAISTLMHSKPGRAVVAEYEADRERQWQALSEES